MTNIDISEKGGGVNTPVEQKEWLGTITSFDFDNGLGVAEMETDATANTRTPKNTKLLYGIEEIPPLSLLLCLAAQVVIQKIPNCATWSILIGEAVCGDSAVNAKLLSTMIFLVGLTTFLQTTVGVRLPVFQGPAITFVIVIVSRAALPDWTCSTRLGNETVHINTTDEATWRLQESAGSLMVASGVHAVLGMTGVVGFLTRFIGPPTIVPAMVLLSLDLAAIMGSFAKIHWGVTIFTSITVLIFASYIGHLETPLPAWNRERGLHINRVKLFRPFAICFGIAAGWLLCFILTLTGRLSSDPEDLEFEARTDGIAKSVDEADWFYAPYPGQFGPARFNIGLFVGYMVTMLVSVLDSVADYYATSKVGNVSDPPPHAINRGLFVEGLCSVLSGAYGAAHATTTHANVIGDMAVTGVASRRVLQVSAVMMMVLAFIGKFVAFFLTIPKPVMAGFSTVGIASLVGVMLSSLNEINMERPRNIIAVGFPILFGYMVTEWVSDYPRAIDVGVSGLNHLFRSILGNSMFVAGFLGCFLDNTLPGKRDVRVEGISDDQSSGDPGTVYELPYISGFLRRQPWTRYVPILPGFVGVKAAKEDKDM